MHKRLFNEAFIRMTIQPRGPILVKAGETGADPTLPDMEFVRTNGLPYLPGSSLKGVLRAHGERLARTVSTADRVLACDPLNPREACGDQLQNKNLTTAEIHKQSCLICRLFGNTALASRLHITDAMPLVPETIKLEERNGVAIDRVFGSVAVGPFNYETMTEGELETTVFVRNFTCAQLGLLALVLRDLQQQRVRIGFGKSRGLGTVQVHVQSVLMRYPVCEFKDDQLQLLGGSTVGNAKALVGIGKFPAEADYGLRKNDLVELPAGVAYQTNEWDEPEIVLEDEASIIDLWRGCVRNWRQEVMG